MALRYCDLLLCAHRARFHVQLELSVPGMLTDFATLPCRGRVIRVFRGSDALSIGDEVEFSLAAYRSEETLAKHEQEAMLLSMDSRTFSHEDLRAARVAELFMSGTPPNLEIADHGRFTTLLAAPTDRPVTARPTEDEVVEALAKSNQTSVAETRAMMAQGASETAARAHLETVWAGKARDCPTCKTSFRSISNKGQCPSCGLIFYASHALRPTEYPH